MFWENEEFKQFWEYLQDEACKQDAWWLDNFLDNALDEWKELPNCPSCNKKLVLKSKDFWSKTGNYILKVETRCKFCNSLIEIDDCKERLIQLVKNGEVKVKEVPILKEELEID